MYYCTLEIHNVFVLVCLYSLFNIYYKHIIFRSSIPSLIQAWLPPSLIRYPGHSQPSLLLRPFAPCLFGTQDYVMRKIFPGCTNKLDHLSRKNALYKRPKRKMLSYNFSNKFDALQAKLQSYLIHPEALNAIGLYQRSC